MGARESSGANRRAFADRVAHRRRRSGGEVQGWGWGQVVRLQAWPGTAAGEVSAIDPRAATASASDAVTFTGIDRRRASTTAWRRRQHRANRGLAGGADASAVRRAPKQSGLLPD